MAEILSCPSCQRKLQVSDDLMGQDVQCPSCSTTFLARLGQSQPTTVSPLPAEEREERTYPLEPSRRRQRNDEADYDARSESRRRRRANYEPHRGGVIMALGIISLFIAGIVLGPIAWIMGNNDLAAIRSGRMDPEGESQTNTGRICGMIATILNGSILVISLVGVCVMFVCMGMCATAPIVNQPPQGFPPPNANQPPRFNPPPKINPPPKFNPR